MLDVPDLAVLGGRHPRLVGLVGELPGLGRQVFLRFEWLQVQTGSHLADGLPGASDLLRGLRRLTELLLLVWIVVREVGRDGGTGPSERFCFRFSQLRAWSEWSGGLDGALTSPRLEFLLNKPNLLPLSHSPPSLRCLPLKHFLVQQFVPEHFLMFLPAQLDEYGVRCHCHHAMVKIEHNPLISERV